MNALRRDDGFGMIDTLVGITLAAILMLGIGGVMRTGFAATRTASEEVRGDDDAQTLTTYLTRDLHAAVADTQLTSVTGGGASLTLGVPDVAGARFTTVTYAYDGTAGTVTRTVTAAGQTPVSVTVARSLALAYAPVFEYCSPVSFAITPAITAGSAAQVVAVSNTTNVKPGLELTVDAGAGAETVVATDATASTITAVFSKAHAAGVSASNACQSVAANVPFTIDGTLMVRTIRVSLHVRPS